MFDELVRQGEGIVHGDRMLESWGISSGSNEAEAVLQNPPDLDSARGREFVTDFGNGVPKRSIYPEYSTFKSSNGYSRKTRSLKGALSPLGNRSI
jgi:hypothetical protein